MQLVPTYPQHREKESKHQGYKSRTAWLPACRARILVCHFAHHSWIFTWSTLVGFFTLHNDTYVQVICITREKHQSNPIQHHKLKSLRIYEILYFVSDHYITKWKLLIRTIHILLNAILLLVPAFATFLAAKITH